MDNIFGDKFKTRNNREIYEERLKELKAKFNSERITGRSNRILNEYIEDFFHKPMGTKIEIFDHYPGWNAYDDFRRFDVDHDPLVSIRKAREMMCRSIKRRLDTEYPNVEYELTRDFFLIRKSPTYHEQLSKEIIELENKLKELK